MRIETSVYYYFLARVSVNNVIIYIAIIIYIYIYILCIYFCEYDTVQYYFVGWIMAIHNNRKM